MTKASLMSADLMSTIAICTALVFTPLIIINGLYLLNKKNTTSSNAMSGSVVLFGLALIVFDVMSLGHGVSVFSFDPKNGVTIKSGVSDQKADETNTAANILPFIDKTNRSLEVVNTAISEQDKKINALVLATKPHDAPQEIKQLKTPPIPTIPVTINQAGKTVLIFYRNNERTANSIVAALRAKGFKSAASNSSLNEIKKWVTDTGVNSITIASNGINNDLIESLKKIVLDVAPDTTKVHTDDDWSFKTADAQIYIF